MVERLVKVVCEPIPFTVEETGEGGHVWVPEDIARHLVARVIKAMREPTEGMIAAGMAEAEVDLASEYRAMIEAALSGS